MKTEKFYVSPEVELIDITIEGCFAVSGESNDPDDLTYEIW